MSIWESIRSSAILIVTPNNPTGKILTKENFSTLVSYCKAHNKLLILDCCFRAYIPSQCSFDQYGILSESGADYIVIEDTGKTWPTAELKVALLTVSAAKYQPLYRIYTDMLLHVSPFTVRLMTEFVEQSANENFAYIRQIAKENRHSLYSHIQGTLLLPQEEPYTSVSWLQVSGMTGTALKAALDARRVHVLAGDLFYWSDHRKGSHFIRVALIRDTDIFSQAANIIGEVCRELANTTALVL